MIALVRDLFAVLTRAQRRRFIRLQLLVVIRAFTEIAGVASIGPFMLLVSDIGALAGDGRLAHAYRWSGIDDPYLFLVALGGLALLVLAASSAISVLTTSRLLAFSGGIGAQLQSRLFAHYMRQPWLFHTLHNSAQLTKKITIEASRLTRGLVTPVLQLIANLALAIGMTIALCFVDPLVTLVGAALFGVAYLFTYSTVRRTISRNGKLISQTTARKFKLLSEALGGIRELILRGRRRGFVERFDAMASDIARREGRNLALAQTPRAIIELVALAAMIAFVSYLVLAHRGQVAVILPLLSVYGLAAFKLLPAFQNMYSNLATMKSTQAAFESLQAELLAALERDGDSDGDREPTAGRFATAHEVILEGVSFTYPGKPLPTLRDIDLRLPPGALVGLVGASGAGKSTLIDVLLGLLEPSAGRVLVDGAPLSAPDLAGWRRSVAFVPQAIFLIDATIAENVAFGTDDVVVDPQRLATALRLAQLEELVAELPEGAQTRVGERGIQLSGGQRQRIGIARALYADSSLLILDEATNALDVGTEKAILDAVVGARAQRSTLLVSHRLKTVRACDWIYFVADGRIADGGRYDDLVARSAEFRALHWLS